MDTWTSTTTSYGTTNYDVLPPKVQVFKLLNRIERLELLLNEAQNRNLKLVQQLQEAKVKFEANTQALIEDLIEVRLQLEEAYTALERTLNVDLRD